MKLNLSYGFNMFGRITTCMVFFSSIYIYFTTGEDTGLTVSFLWEELFVAFLTSVPFFITNEKNKSIVNSALSLVALYLYINVIVLVAGFVFDWYDLTKPVMIIAMLATILVVFLAVTVITYKIDMQSANEINERLNERRNRRGTNED
ncbi:MAG: hypothetical protein PUD20_07625 [bacterium]|nr:hypothetical protein [bacterium]